VKESTGVLAAVVGALCVGAAYTLRPLWAPLVVAAWVATLLAPLLRRLSGERHRRRSAAVLTTALIVIVLIPIIVVGAALAGAAVDLARGVLESPNQTEALKALFLQSSEQSLRLDQLGVTELMQLLREHGRSAASALSAVAGATTQFVVGLVVFVLATYAFLVDGPRLHAWLAERAVMERADFERMAEAFVETGRGLLIGTGLTATIQGVLATAGYFALGVPRALVLGSLTAIASLIPSIGTALVWVPVTLGLSITRGWGSAMAMLAIGLVVSTVDNLIRPALSRAGALRLPTLAVFVAMLGGISVFGAWGLLLGPLLVRLAVEGLDIVSDHRRVRGATSASRSSAADHEAST
jgi:predicted PurR-regulated permease PerM